MPARAIQPRGCRQSPASAGYLLVEVIMALAIVAMLFGVIINSYIQAGMRAEWSGYSLAAQNLSIQQIELARSAPYDPSNTSTNASIGLTNLTLMGRAYNSATSTWTGYTNAPLDVPVIGTNTIMATNYVSVQLLTVTSLALCQVYQVRVDTVWPFFMRGANAYFTNTSIVMLAPDNSVQAGQTPVGSQ
jgi:type II secretory pathway pseudopilin PulG